MNRPIKFRAWDGSKMIYSDESDIADFFWAVREEKIKDVMQFTGLLDRHGKEIYEGDIVCTEYNPENHENCPKQFHDVVEYKDGAYSTFNPANGYEYGSDPNECEVLGNIYENSDLL